MQPTGAIDTYLNGTDPEDEARKRALLAKQSGITTWDDIDATADAVGLPRVPTPQAAPPPPLPTPPPTHVPVPGVDYNPAGATLGDELKGVASGDWDAFSGSIKKYAGPAADLLGKAAKDTTLGMASGGLYPLHQLLSTPASDMADPARAAAAPKPSPAPIVQVDVNSEKNARDAREAEMMRGLGKPGQPGALDIPPLMKGHGPDVTPGGTPAPAGPPPPMKRTGPGWADDPRVTGPGSALAAGAYHDAPLPTGDTAYSLADIASRNRATDVTNREYLANLADIDQQDSARTAISGGTPIELAIKAQEQSQKFEEGQPWGSQSILRYSTDEGQPMQDAPQTMHNRTIGDVVNLEDKMALLHAQSQGKEPYMGFKNVGEMQQYLQQSREGQKIDARYRELLASGVPLDEAKKFKDDAELQLVMKYARDNPQAYAALMQAKNNPNAMLMVPPAEK